MLSQSRLKEVLSYDPETGIFTRKGIPCRSGSVRSVGSVAGAYLPAGYITIMVDYKAYLAHRLAWLYMAGSWPSLAVDHKNGQKDDNRWANLREATAQQNAFNQPAKALTKSGFKGVCKSSGSTWKASIKVNGKPQHIGSYPTPELAYEEYLARAAQIQGEFKHAPGA